MSNFLVPYFILFGVLTIAGGVIGFVKAQSKASLIAGGVSGLLLLLAAYLMHGASVQAGIILGLIISLLLAGRFIPAFIKKRSFMPAGMMSILSVIGVVLAIAGLLS